MAYARNIILSTRLNEFSSYCIYVLCNIRNTLFDQINAKESCVASTYMVFDSFLVRVEYLVRKKKGHSRSISFTCVHSIAFPGLLLLSFSRFFVVLAKDDLSLLFTFDVVKFFSNFQLPVIDVYSKYLYLSNLFSFCFRYTPHFLILA